MTDMKLIDLGCELDAVATALDHYAAKGCGTEEAEAAEEDRLWLWSDRVLNAIAEVRPSGREGLGVKIRAIEHLNQIGELSPEDRILGAETQSDRLAWAIVRDLMAERAV